MTATIIAFPAARRLLQTPPEIPDAGADCNKPEPDYRQQFLDMWVPSSHPLAVASRKPRRKPSKDTTLVNPQ
jgi:hypothetical protein